MIKMYEAACKNAGLTEEQTAEIRRMFEADYKRLARRNKAQTRNNIVTVSVTVITAEYDELGDFEIQDNSNDLEELVLKEIELMELR